MTKPSVYVQSVEVQQERVCIPRLSQGSECTEHDHLPGRRDLVLEIRPVGGSEEEWQALVGKTLLLGEVPS